MLRCPVCRTRRKTFSGLLKHQQAAEHTGPCTCSGYHHPHRPGSPCCTTNPYVRTHQAIRAGASDEDRTDAFIDDALLNDHKFTTQKEAPF
jgi:hypothetical protein